MNYFTKLFMTLVLALVVTVSCMSLARASDTRDITVDVPLYDNTTMQLNISDVPNHIEIPYCQQSGPAMILCTIIDTVEGTASFLPIMLSSEDI